MLQQWANRVMALEPRRAPRVPGPWVSHVLAVTLFLLRVVMDIGGSPFAWGIIVATAFLHPVLPRCGSPGWKPYTIPFNRSMTSFNVVSSLEVSIGRDHQNFPQVSSLGGVLSVHMDVLVCSGFVGRISTKAHNDLVSRVSYHSWLLVKCYYLMVWLEDGRGQLVDFNDMWEML